MALRKLLALLNVGFFIAKCDLKLVKTILPESVTYGRDGIFIACIQHDLRDQDSIYSFLLSKEINGKTDEIVKIEADTNNPPKFLRAVWYDKELQSRSSIEHSQLIPVSSARLHLFIQAANVSCKDDGIFRCEIFISGGRSGSSSASLPIKVLDSTIKVTDTTPALKSVYDIDDTVKLKCSATFSTPSCLRWCIKRADDWEFKEYKVFENVMYSELKNDGCEYSRHSVLNYNISAKDISTQFACEISATSDCSSNTKHDIITLRNTNMDLITANISEHVIYKMQSLKINCVSKQLNLNDKIDTITLSKVYTRTETLLVKAKYSRLFEKTLVSWNDDDFKDRATIHSIKIVPSESAILNIEIPATKVECWDAVTYRCGMFLIGDKYSLQKKTVKLIANGKYIKASISSNIKLGQDDVDIVCSTSFFDNKDTINQIVLSKEDKEKTNKLVSIELSFSPIGFSTYTRWHDKTLKTRSEVLKAVVYPADQAKLHIKLNAKAVLCEDSGKYICEVFASNAKNGRSENYVNITVDSKGIYSVTEKTCSQSNGQYTVGHVVMLHCGGEIGNPPIIPQWCKRNQRASEMMLFPNDSKVSYTSLRKDDCQFFIYSMLEYTVTEDDLYTEFACAASVEECELAMTNSKFVIQRVSASENQTSFYQMCYRDNVQEDEIGCEKIGGYIGGVSFLCIMSAILVFGVCYYCRKT